MARPKLPRIEKGKTGKYRIAGQDDTRVSNLRRGTRRRKSRGADRPSATGAPYKHIDVAPELTNDRFPNVTKKLIVKGKLFRIEYRGRFRGYGLADFVQVDRGGHIRFNIQGFDMTHGVNRKNRTALMKLLADEAIRSVKGMSSLTRDKYPYGILRGVGPSGRRWTALSKWTLRNRKYKASSQGYIDPVTEDRIKIKKARGQSFKLRETSEHIYKRLKPLHVDHDSFSIGWKGRVSTSLSVSELAIMQHRGYSMTFNKKTRPRSVRVPARPFIGFQREFFKNVNRITVRFLAARVYNTRKSARLIGRR